MSSPCQTTFTWASLQPALPEIYLTAAICVLLMVDVFAGEQAPLDSRPRSRW